MSGVPRRMPGTMLPTDMMLRVVGSESMMSRVSTCVRAACGTSTSGVWPDTVIVSSSAPTFMSALTVAVKFAGSSMPSRTTVENPGQRERHFVGALPEVDDREAAVDRR